VGGEGKIESKKGRGTTIVVDIPLVKKETIAHGED
jgi:two-component system, NarL family, sensor histidine kinase DegS